MSGLGNARELLLIEALGDAAQLFDRVEHLLSALEASSQKLEQGRARIEAQAVALEARMTSATERMKVETVNHIAQRTDAVARRLNSSLTHDMQTVAQGLFEKEVQTALQRLGQFIDLRIAQSRSRFEWWINGAMVCSAVALTYTLTAYLLGR